MHEAAHAWTADRLGDPTARLLGRVSLNPIVHIDLIGTILLPLIAVISNFPIIGWAKPVPVNISRLRRHRAAISCSWPPPARQQHRCSRSSAAVLAQVVPPVSFGPSRVPALAELSDAPEPSTSFSRCST